MIDNESAPLHPITDHISLIRRMLIKEQNFHSSLSGPFLAAQLARDLILTRSVPVYVDCVDGWWLVSSDKDWLLQPDGTASLWNFSHIVHFPQVGREACRSEILLTAFAQAVITRGATDELTWITGDREQWPLPVNVLERLSRHGLGRIVAFTLSDDQSGH